MTKGIKNIVQSKPACRSHYSYNHLIAVCILANRPRTEISSIPTNRKHKVSPSVHKRQGAAHRNVEMFNWGYRSGDGEQPCPHLPNSRGAGALWSAVHTFLEHLELSRGVKKSTSRWGRLIALEGLGTSWEQRMCSTAHRSQAGHCVTPSCAEKNLLFLV